MLHEFLAISLFSPLAFFVFRLHDLTVVFMHWVKRTRLYCLFVRWCAKLLSEQFLRTRSADDETGVDVQREWWCHSLQLGRWWQLHTSRKFLAQGLAAVQVFWCSLHDVACTCNAAGTALYVVGFKMNSLLCRVHFVHATILLVWD